MPVAEVGKEYTHNGKRYVACKTQEPQLCKGCDLYAKYSSIKMSCPKLIRNGKPYTCYDVLDRNDVIFVEVEDEKKS